MDPSKISGGVGGELIRPASSDTSGTPNLKLAKAKEVSESENQISKALGREGTPVLETTEEVAFGSFLGGKGSAGNRVST